MRLFVGTLLLSTWLFGQFVPETLSPDSMAGRVTLETVVPDEVVYVGEHVRVIVRVGVDRALLREGLVQPYARPLDLPIHLEATWLRPDGPLAARYIPPRRRSDGRATVTRSLAVNDAITSAVEADDMTRGGMRLAVFELHRTLTPRRAGELALDPVTVRYAIATRFSVDFLGNRNPEDRVDGAVRGEATSLSVLSLPTTGRPLAFHGLIGQYRLEAATLESKGPLTEGFAVHVNVVGEGNAESVRTLRIEPIPGFRVRGLLDPGGAAPRALTLDLVPVGRLPREVPAIRMAVFDPMSPGSYRFVESQSIRLPTQVRGSSEAVLQLRVAEPRSWMEESGVAWRLLLLVPWALLACGWFFLLQRDRDRADPLGARARRAYRSLRVASKTSVSAHGAFGGYLAAKIRSPEPGIVDRGLGARLVEIGIPQALADSVAARWLSGVDSRYGALGTAMGFEEALALARQVEDALRRKGRNV